MPGRGRVVVLGGAPLATYRFSAWKKTGFIGLGAIFTLAAVVGMAWLAWAFKPDMWPAIAILGPLAVAAFALGVSVIISASRGSLALYGDYLVYTGLRRRIVWRKDIARTRRAQEGFAGFSIVLDLKSGRKVHISAFGPLDDVLTYWLDEFPNAEWDAQVQREDRLLANPVWGTTPEERERNINRDARRLNWLYWPGWALMIWAFAFPQPYEVCLSVLLALPVIALIMVMASRGRWSLLEDVDSGRLEVGSRLFFLPCGALALRAFLDHQLIDWITPLIYAVGVGALLTALTGLIERRLPMTAAIVLLLLWTGYAWGGVLFVDTTFDTAYYEATQVRILDKSQGGHDHSLTVTAWGKKPDGNSVNVSGQLYYKLHKGDPICIYLHPGRLGWPWYEAGRCPVNP